MIQKGIAIKGAKVLMLGITFKENCPDVRNTKIVDVLASLQDYGLIVDVYDPWANAEEVRHEYGYELQTSLENQKYEGIVLGVAHKEFQGLDLNSLKSEIAVVYDVKGILTNEQIDQRL